MKIVRFLVPLCLAACTPQGGSEKPASTPPVAGPVVALSASASAAPPVVATTAPAAPRKPAAPRSPRVCEALQARPQSAKPPAIGSFTSAPCAKSARDYAAALKRVAKLPSNEVAAAEEAFRCVPVARGGKVQGAFATALDGAQLEDGGLTARLLLVWTDASGKRLAEVAPKAAADGGRAKGSNLRIKEFSELDRVEDFRVLDLGGQDVAFLVMSAAINEGGSRTVGQLFSRQPTAPKASGPSPLAPYHAPGTRTDLWIGMLDVDGDGRLDLLTTQPFAAMVTSESGSDYAMHGPTFVAHAKADGTFAPDDATAKDAASCACPEAPTAESGLSTLETVACARVWGMDPTSLVARRCSAADPPRDCADREVQKLFQTASPVSLP